MSDKDILYEVKLLHQWKLDREPVYSDESKLGVFKKFDLRRFLPEKNKDISQHYNSQLPWQFAVSNPDRTLLAVLQEKYLEIRHKRDDYEKPIGRVTIPEDEHPQWRKLTWSSDGVCIALSMSHGELRCYNTFSTLICSVPKVDDNYDSSAAMPNGALAALFLIDARTKNAEWPYELIAIDFNGYLRSYFVSSNEGYKPYHTFSFGETALTSASYISTFNILVVAFPRHSLNPQSKGDTLGLSSWRMLIDHPYYRLTKPGLEDLCLSNKRSGWFSLLTGKSGRSVILKMSVSLNTKFLACMHSCGSVSVWTLPQLSMHKSWLAQNLPQYDQAVEKETKKSDSDSPVLMDIGWCLDSKLVILYASGMLTVSNLDCADNLLARINSQYHVIERQPEFFFPPARLANICDMTIGFLMLNHELKEFSSWRRESDASDVTSDSKLEDESMSKSVEVADNHSMLRLILRFFVHFEMFHQQKQPACHYVEKTYKLTALKNVTPEELYEQKINSEEYAEALDFANLFCLDENRVYKKQWLNSCPVTESSIHDHLLKISDKKWIIHQCCERIPETLECSEILLKKGLEYTDFSEFILDDQDIETKDSERYELTDTFDVNLDKMATHFTPSQLHMLKLRKHLLAYWDALAVYKKILDLGDESGKYDPEEYRKFRVESPLSLALRFAHDANAEAIYVLLSYYTDELTPHWLEVLDNIPECITPTTYQKLLPKFNDQHELVSLPSKRIRPAEWSESGEFKDLIARKPCSSRSQYTLSKKGITEWYEKKIREIVDESGLIDYALELLNVATKNNVSGLENLRHNLLVLDELAYRLLLDEPYSLATMERYSDLEKLVLMMSEFTTRESFRVAISEILLPFLNRCEMLRSNSRDALIDAYFKRLSENDLMLPFTFFEYLTEKDKDHLLFSAKKKLELRLLCVYSCNRVDQVDTAINIIEIETEFSDNNNSNVEETMNLRSRLTELHTELVVMQLLRGYGCEKNITFVHSNKLNEQFQKDVFTIMVNSRMNMRAPSLKDIHTLFDDMTYVQENLFNALPENTYLRIFAYTVLTAGRADFIESYASFALCCSSKRKTSVNPKISRTLGFNESVSIIVEAAQYYFNVASSYEDSSISLAKACLSLIAFHPDLERERRLIDALKIMNGFGVHVVPLKVRMCVDYKKMVQKVFKAEPKAYRKMDQIVSLASNLVADENTNRSDLEIEVLNLAVDAAFNLKDYTWSSSTILKLMDSGKSCWNLCKKLCQCDEYEDLETKQKLIKYALMQCPDKELMFLIEFRNKIECQLLQQKLKKSFGQPKRENAKDADDVDSTSKETTESFHQKLISVPALMNMLHTSSSHVLNVDFWKNTFNLNLERYLNDSVQNANADCEKLAFSEFYGDVQAGGDCVFNRSAATETEIFQQLLRFYLLRAKDAADVDNVTETDIEDVIAQYAIASFSNDCLLCLSLLSLFKDADYSEKVFSSLPETAIVEKFALYYYSLRFLVGREVAVHDLVTNETPSALVLRALEETKNVDCEYATLVKKYSRALGKRQGVNKLQDLGCGIDSTRFFADETYKLDSVLGLAMYEEREKLDLALSLGAEHGVPSEDIVLSHVKSLFLSGNVSLLTARLKEPDVVETLKRNSAVAVERLSSDVYDGLFGCDYQILLVYYALMNQISEDGVFHHLKPKEHMKLLRKLKSFTKEIDYKLLTADRPQVLEAMTPVVFSSEPKQLVNFLLSLPSVIRENVVLEDVFEQIATKIFFNGPANLSYEKRFERLLPVLEKMEGDRVTSLLHQFLFSKYSCENIDTDSKRAVLSAAVESVERRNVENDENLIRRLKNYSQSLIKIEELNEICKAIDIDETYLRELEKAVISDENARLLKDTIVKMVLDLRVSADVINVILEFVRAGSLPDFITELLNTDLSEESAVEPLLRRIENCLEDNEYEKCWSDQLNSRLHDSTIWKVHESYIEKIVTILNQSDDDVYQAIERLHETRLILREWVAVHSRISLFDVIDEESRLALLEKLVRQASSLSQFHCLMKLFNFWPRSSDSTSWEKNPWMLLAEKVLALKEDEIPGPAVLNLFEEIIVHAKLTKETKRTFFEYIGSVPHNKVLMVWFCILCNDDLLVQSISGYIDDLRVARKMPKKIEDHLKRVQSS